MREWWARKKAQHDALFWDVVLPLWADVLAATADLDPLSGAYFAFSLSPRCYTGNPLWVWPHPHHTTT